VGSLAVPGVDAVQIGKKHRWAIAFGFSLRELKATALIPHVDRNLLCRLHSEHILISTGTTGRVIMHDLPPPLELLLCLFVGVSS
jgi:hypothetical protein